jgi:response regulator RpfG family c-di-GMP phosphodiesterase
MDEPHVIKPKILIVDDNPQHLFAIGGLLKKLEVEVMHATSGPEALGLTLEYEFCLVITDVQMPGMDGYEFVELLRGNPSTASLPVIFISAIRSDEYRHRKAYDTGPIDFIGKPFVAEILLSKVKVFLELYRQRIKLQALADELDAKAEDLENEINYRLKSAALNATESRLEPADAKPSLHS